MSESPGCEPENKNMGGDSNYIVYCTASRRDEEKENILPCKVLNIRAVVFGLSD